MMPISFYSGTLLFLFFADKFEGKIPVPPIQELFELEPNIQTKRYAVKKEHSEDRMCVCVFFMEDIY